MVGEGEGTGGVRNSACWLTSACFTQDAVELGLGDRLGQPSAIVCSKAPAIHNRLAQPQTGVGVV